METSLPRFLNVASHFLFFGWVGVFVHGPQRALEKVVHRLDRSAFHLREAEVDKHYSCIGEERVQQESTVAHLGNHVRCGACDAVVDDPVDEEAEGHAERALRWRVSESGLM